MINACAVALKRRLAAAGTWMGREDLQQGIGYSAARVDDELADLVLAGQVLYNERGREYRLAGTPLARRALRLLIEAPDLKRRVIGQQSTCKQFMQLGIATRSQDADGAELLVMAELQFDYPKKDDAEGMPRMYWQLLNAFDTADRAEQAKGQA